MRAVRVYREPMEPGELSFLLKKEGKERSQYYKTFRLLMILSFIIPFAGAWYRAADGAPNAFSVPKFFITATVLLSISSVSTYITYMVNLRKLQLDIKEQTKTIEYVKVTRKMYVAARKAYYCYINSPVKMSIEVSHEDYERVQEGDELCIEYSTHSRNYFGYF